MNLSGGLKSPQIWKIIFWGDGWHDGGMTQSNMLLEQKII